MGPGLDKRLVKWAIWNTVQHTRKIPTRRKTVAMRVETSFIIICVRCEVRLVVITDVTPRPPEGCYGALYCPRCGEIHGWYKDEDHLNGSERPEMGVVP